jgi:hypothetical protein
MAQDIDPFKLSSPRIFLVRMSVFLILCALVVVVLYKQIWTAFLANPGLNALIIGVLGIGIAFAFRQVIRLFRGQLGQRVPARRPGPRGRAAAGAARAMAVLLRDRIGRMAISSQNDARHPRFDRGAPGRGARHGALHDRPPGLPWAAQDLLGLIETVGSVGNVINTLKPGGDAGAIFDSLKEGLAAPLSGMGISFSSSLFGLAGSLVLGFLDLQTSQAQNRFYTDLEDWLSTTVRDLGGLEREAPVAASGTPALSSDLKSAIERLRDTISEGGSSRATTTAWPISRRLFRAGSPHAHGAADDSRLGRFAGPAASRYPPAARNSGARRRQEVSSPQVDPWPLHAPAATAAWNYWPEIRRPLSTLILGIIFLLTVFVGPCVLPDAGGHW